MLSAVARLCAQPLLADSASAAAHHARLLGALRRLRSGDGAPLAAAPAAGAPTPWEERERVLVEGGVAIIPVSGTLAGGLDAQEAWWFGCCRYEWLQAAAAQLSQRADVHTVVLALDSPGGYVAGCAETAALLERWLGGKLTIAWTSSQACSCAYWLATACARIVATPSATVGSVGVLAVYHDYSAMYAEAGIKVEVYRSGTYKGAGTPGTELTAEQREFIQAGVDALGASFRAHVSARRPQVAEADMQGQWFTGAQAVERGLADATALHLAEVLQAVGQARAF
jgi:signal peptide peptidase SppA